MKTCRLLCFAGISIGFLSACAAQPVAPIQPSTQGMQRARPPSGGSFTTLYAFRGQPDGQLPESGVVMDSKGNLYGNTAAGGVNGSGTIFKLTPTSSGYSERVILSYTSATDGDQPTGLLAIDNHGDVFGSAPYGGPPNNGTVVELKPGARGKYREVAVHSFEGYSDGATPTGVVMTHGLLYAALGGSAKYDSGSIDAVQPRGLAAKIVYDFGRPSGGGTQFPSWDLVGAAGGKYYSSTKYPVPGAVYSFDPSSREVSTLFDFSGKSGGTDPVGAIGSKSGTVYGMTAYGGSANVGVVYDLTPSGTAYKEKVLHSFANVSGDGYDPAGTLLLEGKTLYGTTTDGGTGCGTIFRIDTSGRHYTVLYDFPCGAGGANPSGDLLWSNGAIYGVTASGGAATYGTVYKFVP